MTQVSEAACPGPPAKKKTGSGSVVLPVAGAMAMFRLIFRPSGSSGFRRDKEISIHIIHIF